MDFKQAVAGYEQSKTKENLENQISLLMAEMTEKEKIHMLSGHTLGVTQKGIREAKRNYNYYALPAGGCKRLGIPSVNFTDGPRGVVMKESTCFPVSSLRASSFDPELEYRIGKAIAAEAIAQDANYFAGVCINLVRNPRWGRSQESYGEDPFLTGIFGETLVKSVQEEGMMACPKHFAVNSIEDLRFFVNVKADERTMYEVYLPHFKKCVEAGALSVMGAYNRFDDFYCCENKRLLDNILRKEWGFDGFVMSDFVNGVKDAERSLRAGCDVEMMFTMKYYAIPRLLKKGRLNRDQIDRAVANILRSLIRSVPRIKSRNLDVVDCKEHRDLALEAAEKGMVLIENNGILPLQKTEKVAVAGKYANTENVGDYGSSRVYNRHVVNPYEGLKNEFADVTLCQDMDIEKAVDATKNASTVVITAGSNRELEGEFFATASYKTDVKPKNSGGDRQSLRLLKEEIELIKAMKQAGKKVIVVLYSGSVILCDEWKPYADAVLVNYYSGEEGGNALAHILSGKVNPSGKLPFTIAENESDYPKFIGMGDKPYEITYGYYHGYTLFDKSGKKISYPFGYGLSYTTFEIENLQIENKEDSVILHVSVTNKGKRDGAEIVQVYASSKGAKMDGLENLEESEVNLEGETGRFDRPIKLLKGFKRVELKAGEKKEIEITIAKKELRFYDAVTKQWMLDPAYTFYVGNNSHSAMNFKVEVEKI